METESPISARIKIPKNAQITQKQILAIINKEFECGRTIALSVFLTQNNNLHACNKINK